MTRASKRARRRGPGRHQQIALGLLGAVVVISPHLIGGRPGWAVALIAAVAGAAAFVASIPPAPRTETRLDRAPLFVAAAALAWTCIATIPLPVAWAAVIDPRGVQDARAAAILLGHAPPAYWSWARSPWASAEQIVVGSALVAAFAAALWLCERRQRDTLAKLVCISIASIAVSAVAHQTLGATSIYGFYTPRIISGWMLSPIINENQLSGFLGMGVPLMVVLGIEEERRPLRAAWWLAALSTAIVAILCISRSGLGSLVIGLAMLALLRMRVRSQEEHASPRRWLLVAGVLFVGIGVIVVVFGDEIGHDLAITNLDKVRLALRGLDLIAQSPWTGIGRGGYSEAMVHIYGTVERVEQPESVLIQWASEWGVPMTILLVVVLVRAWIRAIPGAGNVKMGALAGIASIAAHDQLDFAMERAGVAVVVAVLLAVALVPSSGELPTATSSSAWFARTLPRVLGLGALAAALLLGPGLGGRRTRELEDELVADLERHDAAAFDRALERAIVLHPGEPTFPLLGAFARVERRDSEAARWLNRAMLLAPGWVGPHLLAARWLASRGALRQAWIEVRAAERLQGETGRTLACALAERGGAIDEALRLFADQPTVLDRLAACPGLPAAISARIDAALLDTDLVGPRLRIARRAMGAADAPRAVAVLEAVVGNRDPDVVLRLAQIYEQSGRAADAIGLLREDPLEPWAGGDGFTTLARAYADVGDATAMRSTVERLRGLAHGSGPRIASSLSLLGSLEHRLGNDGRALRAYEQAARLDPACGALAEVATLSEALGDRGRAYRAWAEVCRADGPESSACSAAARLRGGT